MEYLLAIACALLTVQTAVLTVALWVAWRAIGDAKRARAVIRRAVVEQVADGLVSLEDMPPRDPVFGYPDNPSRDFLPHS